MLSILLDFLLLIVEVGLVLFFLPVGIGALIAYLCFTSGHYLGGIIAVLAGLLVQIFFFTDFGSFPSSGSGECPYCGSDDTDGNHCYNCNDDF